MTTLRRRKAYRCTVDGYDESEIVAAPSASKARGLLWSRLSDAWGSQRELAAGGFAQIRVTRAREHDVLLPPPHPIVKDLSERERQTLLHAYGGTGARAGYRGHFATDEGDPDLVRLVMRGLMDGPISGAGPRPLHFFHLNWMGRQVALSMQPDYPTPY